MSQANIDIQAINLLDSGLNHVASDLASLRGEVRAYMDNAVMQANQIVDRFRRIEAQCQRVYDVASAAYSSCLEHQHYDKECECYTPSCNCEKRNLNAATKALERARSNRQTAESYLKEIEFERSRYFEARHADYTMGVLIDNNIPEATKRLCLFREHVENHDSMETALTSSSLGNIDDDSYNASSGRFPTKAHVFREATSQIEHSTVSQFREGMRRIKEKEEEQQRLAILKWASGGDQNERTR